MQKNKNRFNLGEAIIPGIALTFGVAYFIQTMDASLTAIKWPYIIAVLTGILWLFVVVYFVFNNPDNHTRVKNRSGDTKKIALILFAPIVYIASMSFLGFGVSSFIFLAVLFRLLGGVSWVRNSLISFTITAVLYVAMIVLMKMSLPRLILGSFQI